jgi:HSP20 family protein
MAETAAKPAKAPEGEKAVETRAATRPVERRRGWPALREMAFDRMFEDLLEDFDRGFHWPTRLRRRLEPMLAEAPRLAKIDVFQTDGEVVVKAELPGIAKDQIEVVVTGETVSVKAEKKHEEEVKEENYYRSERSFGTVQRVVELPVEVKADKATARMTDGVLEVRIPKTEAAKAGVVKIKVE